MYNQTNEFVYLVGNVNHNADLSIEVDRCIRNAWCKLPEVHPRTIRPTERSPRAQKADAKNRGTRDNAVRLRHVEPARVSLRHAAPSSPQVLDSLHRLAKARSIAPTTRFSIWTCLSRREVRASRRFGGGSCSRICGAHGGYETAEVRDVRRTGGGRRLCWGPGKRVDGMFPGQSQSFRYQRRPVYDCCPERGGMAQNGETRAGIFHGKMDRCRENQGWTTACSRMSKRDGKD